ncbi:hypothetical protein J2S17_005486 [Cytobacillus purgationiresistens]|uniref:Uncharacterized protein n=1 Tax=Cytobacillus purgationiresistens TaxID=863449 RepID=A0ABU0AQK8_9BACI|nr:hypothetical protein [Cytobacillus purgationiresistens]
MPLLGYFFILEYYLSFIEHHEDVNVRSINLCTVN